MARRSGVKRRASGTLYRPATKQQRTYRDRNQYQQLDTLVSRRGRKISSAKFIQKLVKASYDYTKYILRGYALDTAAGSGDTGARFYPLGLEKPAASTLSYYPLYLVNLTTIPQYVRGSFNNQQAIWRMFSDTADPSQVKWYNSPALNNAGSQVGGTWFPYVSSTSAGQGQTWPKGLLEYLSIRATFRGPQKKPTRVVMEVIQPFKWFTNLPDQLGGAASASAANRSQIVWQAEANRLCANMCQNLPGSTKRPWKVLKSFTFELQPTSTTETDVGGHDVHQRWFWKCNRGLNYGAEGATLTFPDSTGNYSDLDLGSDELGKRIAFTPALGSQIYLLIKAYCPVPYVGSGADPTVHPSFDLYVEKKMSHCSINPGV